MAITLFIYLFIYFCLETSFHVFEMVGDLVWGWWGVPQVSSVSECFMLIASPGKSISPLLVLNLSKSSQLLKHCAGNRKVVGSDQILMLNAL